MFIEYNNNLCILAWICEKIKKGLQLLIILITLKISLVAVHMNYFWFWMLCLFKTSAILNPCNLRNKNFNIVRKYKHLNVKNSWLNWSSKSLKFVKVAKLTKLKTSRVWQMYRKWISPERSRVDVNVMFGSLTFLFAEVSPILVRYLLFKPRKSSVSLLKL